jgi:hypothetical protein
MATPPSAKTAAEEQAVERSAGEVADAQPERGDDILPRNGPEFGCTRHRPGRHVGHARSPQPRNYQTANARKNVASVETRLAQSHRPGVRRPVAGRRPGGGAAPGRTARRPRRDYGPVATGLADA